MTEAMIEDKLQLSVQRIYPSKIARLDVNYHSQPRQLLTRHLQVMGRRDVFATQSHTKLSLLLILHHYCEYCTPDETTVLMLYSSFYLINSCPPQPDPSSDPGRCVQPLPCPSSNGCKFSHFGRCWHPRQSMSNGEGCTLWKSC